MKTWRIVLISIICLPATVLGWLLGGLSLVLGFAKRPTRDPELPFVLVVEWREWVARHWKYSTTLAFMIAMNPRHVDRDSTEDDPDAEYGRTRKHERKHVRQIIDCSLLALFIAVPAAIVDPWLGFALWIAGPIYQLPNFLGVVVRGDGNIYRRAEHEESAYAGTNLIRPEHVGKSWLEIFDEENRGF